MNRLAFPIPSAARWWITAFFIGVVFSTIAQRFFPDAMPWSEDLPIRTQAALRLFAGIVIGIGLQAVWWGIRRAVVAARK
jgi:hypothetical protein